MENLNKSITITIISIGLILPIFFGVYIDFLMIEEFNWKIFLILIFGLLMFILIDKIIEIFVFDAEKVEVMRNHDVIHSFINRNNRITILLFFTITMIMEELLFRYYLIGFLIKSLEMNIVITISVSSFLFSLYHIHTWFSYKAITILLMNLIYTFLLGLYIGFILLKLGIVPCILIHFIVAFFMYYNIYRRYFKKNI